MIVLIVDDCPDDRYILARAFGKAGVPAQLFEVENATEAMAFLGHSEPFCDVAVFPTPDLMLLDLKMPGQSGFEVLHWLQQHPEKAPRQVVVLSGSERDRDVFHALELGAAAYLNKPPTPEQLRHLLYEQLGLAA